MLVIVSWVSFWLDQGAVPARVSLGNALMITFSYLIKLLRKIRVDSSRIIESPPREIAES